MNISVDLNDLKSSIITEIKSELQSLVTSALANGEAIGSAGSQQALLLNEDTHGITNENISNGSTNGSQELLSQTLLELSAEVKAIRQQVGEAKAIKTEDGKGEAKSPRSLKQTLDTVQYEIKTLRKDVRQILSMSPPHGHAKSVKTEGSKRSPADEPPKKIQKLEETQADITSPREFLALLSNDISSFVVQNGGDERSMSHNLASSVNSLKDFYGLGICISNLTLCNLEVGETYRDGNYEPAPAYIAANCSDAFVFRTPGSWNNRLEGIVSYLVGTTEYRLVIYYLVHSSGNKTGVALCPKHVAVNKDLLVYMRTDEYVDKIRTDKQISERQAVVKLKNFLARATITWGHKSILSVELVKSENNYSNGVADQKWLAFSAGKSLRGPNSIDNYACARKQFGCLILFYNDLTFPVGDLAWEIRSDVCDFLLPSIPAKTKEAFFTSDDLNMQGIFSYRIGTSDLRLALVFQVFNGGIKFAIAFVPCDIATDFALMKSMLNPKEWNTRPDRKYSQANGEQIVEIRNLRAKASMTNGPKATLTVTVSLM